MMKFLRSQSQFVLALILIVIAGSFVLFSSSESNLLTGIYAPKNHYGTINNRPVEYTELTDAIDTTKNALRIRAFINHRPDWLQGVTAQQITTEAWRELLLGSEANRLHIVVTDQEISDAIQALPIFRDKNGTGTFQPQIFQAFLETLQTDPELNISKEQFLDFERQQLRLQAVEQALVGSLHITPAEVQSGFEKYYGPTTLSVITFSLASYLDQVQISPADIETEYKNNPTNPAYRTQEKRKVDYVLFTLSPTQAKLPDADRQKALTELNRQADAFGLSLQPNPSETEVHPALFDFSAEAKKQNLTVQTTDFFSPTTTPAGLPPSPSFNNSAFALTKDQPLNKVEMDNGYALIHLDEIQPSELRPLDEVKDQIEKTLKQKQAQINLKLAANKAGDALKIDLAQGTDFKTALAKLNLTAQTLPPYVPMESKEAKIQELAYLALSLDPGQISSPYPLQNAPDIVLVYVQNRAPADPAKLSLFESTFRASRDGELQEKAITDWFIWRTKQPGTQAPEAGTTP